MTEELEDGELASGEEDVHIIENDNFVQVESNSWSEDVESSAKKSNEKKKGGSKPRRKSIVPPKRRQAKSHTPYNEVSNAVMEPQRLRRGRGYGANVRRSEPPPPPPSQSRLDGGYTPFSTPGAPQSSVYPMLQITPMQLQLPSFQNYQGQQNAFAYSPVSSQMMQGTPLPFAHNQSYGCYAQPSVQESIPRGSDDRDGELMSRRSVDMDISDADTNLNVDQNLESNVMPPSPQKSVQPNRKKSIDLVKLRKRKDRRAIMRDELSKLHDYLDDSDSSDSCEDLSDISNMIKKIEAKCEEVENASKKFDDVMQTFNQAMITMYYCSRAVTNDSIEYMKSASRFIRDARKTAARRCEIRYQQAERVIKRAKTMLDEYSDDDRDAKDELHRESARKEVEVASTVSVATAVTSEETVVSTEPSQINCVESGVVAVVSEISTDNDIEIIAVIPAKTAETVVDTTQSVDEAAPLSPKNVTVQIPVEQKVIDAFLKRPSLITPFSSKGQRKKSRIALRKYFSKMAVKPVPPEPSVISAVSSAEIVTVLSDSTPEVASDSTPIAPVDESNNDANLEREEELRRKLLLRKQTKLTTIPVNPTTEDATASVVPCVEESQAPETTDTPDIETSRMSLSPVDTSQPTLEKTQTTAKIPLSAISPVKTVSNPASRVQSDTVLTHISADVNVPAKRQKRPAFDSASNAKKSRIQTDSENIESPIILQSITSSIRAGILNSNFSIEKGIELLRTNPSDDRPMCYFEQFGICNDTECPYQHTRDRIRTDQQVVEEVISFIPARVAAKESKAVQATRLLAKESLTDVIQRLRQECAHLNYIELAREAAARS